MRFGTFFFFQAAPGLTHEEVVHRELEQMEWTEELGFDQIWLTEHHFIDYGLAVDPATLATAAASRTRRVRIGLAAAILPFHHPLRLAEQLALVDIISKGRLDIGVGRGNRPAEFRGYHRPQQEIASDSTRRWTSCSARGRRTASRMTGGSLPSRMPASFPSRCSDRIR
jgi:Coenzyme F420-dependent N5,N10-methylene tetrahydromethanopterin reductase and related flavin-dependent oxidoreductases